MAYSLENTADLTALADGFRDAQFTEGGLTVLDMVGYSMYNIFNLNNISIAVIDLSTYPTYDLSNYIGNDYPFHSFIFIVPLIGDMGGSYEVITYKQNQTSLSLSTDSPWSENSPDITVENGNITITNTGIKGDRLVDSANSGGGIYPAGRASDNAIGNYGILLYHT